MSINDISQKKNLLGKIGLGTPEMPSNIRFNQKQNPTAPATETRPQQNPTIPQPKPAQPTQKPGCGGCRRKRPG